MSTLCVVTEKYEKKEIENIINDADLIYIGGGDTEQMINLRSLKTWMAKM